MASYRAEDWQEWKSISASDMCNTWEEWKIGVDQSLLEATKEGVIVHMQEIRPDAYKSWIEETGKTINGYTRGEFAGLQMKDRFTRPYTPPDKFPKQVEVTRALRKAVQSNPELSLSKVAEPYLRRPTAGICPIFRADDEGKPEQFGSGILLRLSDRSVLASAAHVLDDFKNHEILIPGQQSLVAMSGGYSVSQLPETGSRNDDKIDVGYFPLDSSFAHSLDDSLIFLDGFDSDPMDETQHNDTYTIIGYQASLSSSEGKTVSCEISRVTCDGVLDHRYGKLGLNPKHHILLQYRMQKGISYETMIQGKKHVFDGMSGGGVFAWSKDLPNPHYFAQPKLCGIVTGYNPHHNVFIATRLGHVLSAILNEFPDLPIFPSK